jgi:hypothetical protein
MNSRQIGLFAAFRDKGVEYAVVGGVAVQAYGYLRATQDLDVFIRPSRENARAVYAALQSLGVPLLDIDSDDLLDDEQNLRFGPSADHVDILSSIGEMTFEQVWRNRMEALVGEVVVPFISKADLLENKRQVGRLRDLADVEELERLQHDVNPEPDPA